MNDRRYPTRLSLRGACRSLATALVAVAAFGLAESASAQILLKERPEEIREVGVTEQLDEQLPLDIPFLDETGTRVTLGEYFDQDDTPVILTFNFFRCAHLCTLTLNGLTNTMRELEMTAGDEYRVVTISIADEEGPVLAKAKKVSYMSQYQRDGVSDDGWRFLTGTRENIDRACEAAGFRYAPVETEGAAYDYGHDSVIIFLTPDGRFSRYMNDVEFDARDVRLALIEASEGGIGSPMERFLLFTCYIYDPDSNSYAASAVKLMRLTGVLTMATIVIGVSLLWLRSPRRTASHPAAPGAVSHGGSQS